MTWAETILSSARALFSMSLTNVNPFYQAPVQPPAAPPSAPSIPAPTPNINVVHHAAGQPTFNFPSTPITSPHTEDTNHFIHTPSLDFDGSQVPSSPPSSANTSVLPGANTNTAQYTATNGHKRDASQDAAQFAEGEGRKLKLKPDHVQQLVDFSKLSANEQRITMHGMLLQQGETLATIQPSEAAYTVSSRLTSLLGVEAFNVLVDPTLSSYSKGAFETLNARIKLKHTLNIPALQKDKEKWSAVENKQKKKLSDYRWKIKKDIHDNLNPPLTDPLTLPSDIVTLAQAILNNCEERAMKATMVQLLARVAWLHYTYREYVIVNIDTNNFWPHVDVELQTIREINNNNPVLISAVMGGFLDHDQQQYGFVGVAQAAATAVFT
ncbi:hypothetical protein OF83DRAFT_1088742 [Amylostereum chailletii]|nr:hypothetical protein OF83DRAFT_1088742 [Amylostereum chailletii]